MPDPMPVADEILQPGELVDGKYRIVRPIGRGGMAAIYLANHQLLDRPVALKVLLPEVVKQSKEAVQRFLHEGRAAARLRNEHVAAVLDVGSLANGSAYLVLEYLEGFDLSTLLHNRGFLPPKEACDYVLQALEAVAHAHARGIVHRDLKPANLFLTESAAGVPTVKVLDFGISKVSGEGAAGLTQGSGMLGSPNFMSPEQVRNPKNVDARSDIWSIGVILYQLLSGRLPFAGELNEVIAAVLDANPVPLSKVDPDLPEGLVAAVERCMKLKKQERFADVGELALALKPFAAPEAQGHADMVVRILAAGAETPGSGIARRMTPSGNFPPVDASGAPISPLTPRPGAPSVSRSQLVAAGAEEPTFTPLPGSESPVASPPPPDVGQAPLEPPSKEATEKVDLANDLTFVTGAQLEAEPPKPSRRGRSTKLALGLSVLAVVVALGTMLVLRALFAPTPPAAAPLKPPTPAIEPVAQPKPETPPSANPVPGEPEKPVVEQPKPATAVGTTEVAKPVATEPKPAAVPDKPIAQAPPKPTEPVGPSRPPVAKAPPVKDGKSPGNKPPAVGATKPVAPKQPAKPAEDDLFGRE